MEPQVEDVMVPDREWAEPPAVEGPPAVVPLVADRALMARLVGDAQREGVAIDGEGGLLAQLTRLVVESALEGELTAHSATKSMSASATTGPTMPATARERRRC